MQSMPKRAQINITALNTIKAFKMLDSFINQQHRFHEILLLVQQEQLKLCHQVVFPIARGLPNRSHRNQSQPHH